jgi:hypothetical protein
MSVILGDVFNIPILTYFTYLNQKGKGDICIRCINSEKEGGGGFEPRPSCIYPFIPHTSLASISRLMKISENSSSTPDSAFDQEERKYVILFVRVSLLTKVRNLSKVRREITLNLSSFKGPT